MYVRTDIIFINRVQCATVNLTVKQTNITLYYPYRSIYPTYCLSGCKSRSKSRSRLRASTTEKLKEKNLKNY